MPRYRNTDDPFVPLNVSALRSVKARLVRVAKVERRGLSNAAQYIIEIGLRQWEITNPPEPEPEAPKAEPAPVMLPPVEPMKEG
jgi:hypothetical protein